MMVKMEINDSYRYIGVLASLMAWLGIVIVLWSWPIIKTNSISKHVATQKKSWLLFAPIETVALALFYVFMVNWFIPVLELPGLYKILISITLLLEVITSWVPDSTGWKKTVHHYTAYSAALLLPILNLFIATSAQTPVIAKVVAYASFAAAVGILCLYAFTKTARQKHLVYQSLYFACFHLPILAVIFAA
jgi:hypothetical protein